MILQTSQNNMDKKNAPTCIMLMYCPDRQGILATVTTFININGGNIIYLAQNVNRSEKVFFMRVEWELDNFSIPKENIRDTFEKLYAKKYDMTFSIYFNDQIPKMALFVSQKSHCLYDLLARYVAGEWNVEIPMIVSNHADLKKAAERFEIPFYHFPINKENKVAQEEATLQLLAENDITFVVLARYMQVLSPSFIEHFPNKIINIHHSFLPAFVGARPYQAAHDRGVKLIGATSHYVTSELDAGPIIEQDIVRVSHRDSVESLVHKGQDLEKIVLSRAVEKHIQRKILTYNNKTIIFN